MADITAQAAVYAELLEVRADLAALKNRETELREQLQAALGNDEAGLIGGQPVITWKTGTRRVLDQNKLQREHTAIFELCRSTVTTRTFRVVS